MYVVVSEAQVRRLTSALPDEQFKLVFKNKVMNFVNDSIMVYAEAFDHTCNGDWNRHDFDQILCKVVRFFISVNGV